jgi:hypothetical protein
MNEIKFGGTAQANSALAHNMLCVESRYNQKRARMVDAAESSRISIIDSSGARMGGALDLTPQNNLYEVPSKLFLHAPRSKKVAEDLTAPAGGHAETNRNNLGTHGTPHNEFESSDFKEKELQIQHESKISFFKLHELKPTYSSPSWSNTW